MSPKKASDFVIMRVFDAPRDLVWKAFTQRERLIRWWGPKGFTMQAAKHDLRPGGVFHYCMRSQTAAICGASLYIAKRCAAAPGLCRFVFGRGGKSDSSPHEPNLVARSGQHNGAF